MSGGEGYCGLWWGDEGILWGGIKVVLDVK